MSINSKNVISSMIWKLLERFSSQLVSFIISIILARILMPNDYGIIAIILVFINFASVIIDGGLNTALIQKKDADQEDFSTIFWFCLLVASFLYIILYIGAPFVSEVYNNEVLTPVLRVLGLNVFFNSFNSIQRAYISRHMLFKGLFYVNAISLVISGLIGIIMAYNGFGVWALVGQTLSTTIVCCIVMWFTVQWHPSFQFSIIKFRGLFSYGWKIFLTNLIVTIYENIRSLLIGKIYEPEALAYFDRGKSLPSLIMSNISASLTSVLLPAFSDEQDDIARVKQMMKRSNQVSYLFVSPLLVFFFLTADDIVVFLLTEKWLMTVPFVKIFCVAFFLMPIQNINATSIQSLGYSNITLKLELIKKIIEAIILVISFLINVYAVAWGIVVYNFICIIINLYPSKRLIDYGVLEQLKDIFPIILCSFIMGLSVFACGFIPLNIIFRIALQLFVGLFLYYYTCQLFRIDSLNYLLSCLRQLVGRRYP